MISGWTQVFGLVGHPVRHSLSPEMYNALFKRYGIDAAYLAFDVAPSEGGSVISAARTLGLMGLNLTVPFKERVVQDLDDLTVAAQEAGAVNVVVRHEDRLTGYNTDGEGFARSLDEEMGGYNFEGKTAVILGTGGAGRAVASGLLDRGFTGIVLLNRTVRRAELAAEALTPRFGHADIRVGPLTRQAFKTMAAGIPLVVNCTSGEGADTIARMDTRVLPPKGIWVDVNYWMDRPPLQRACAERQVHFLTGHGMLIHQAALAFELFTGNPVEASEIRTFLTPR